MAMAFFPFASRYGHINSRRCTVFPHDLEMASYLATELVVAGSVM